MKWLLSPVIGKGCERGITAGLIGFSHARAALRFTT